MQQAWHWPGGLRGGTGEIAPKALGLAEDEDGASGVAYGRALAEMLHADWGWGVRVAKGGIIWRGRGKADVRGDE